MVGEAISGIDSGLPRLSEQLLDRSAYAVVVCGFPGSGKTTMATRLEAMTGALVLDKDTYAPELEENVMSRLNGHAHDRDSDIYRSIVGTPLNLALVSMAFRIAKRYPVIIDAPCLAFIRTSVSRQIRLADYLLERTGEDIPVLTVWVDCDEARIRTRMLARGAARDVSKLADWPLYSETVLGTVLRGRLREVVDYVVDN